MTTQLCLSDRLKVQTQQQITTGVRVTDRQTDICIKACRLHVWCVTYELAVELEPRCSNAR